MINGYFYKSQYETVDAALLLIIVRFTSGISLCFAFILAGVAELVDATDSKSVSLAECRFESDHPHHFLNH